MRSINKSEMSFWGHVSEVRERLIKTLIAMTLFTSIAYIFSDYAIQLLAQPKINHMDKINLQVLKITSMFMIKIYISMVAGLMLSMPVILYQIWRFISPAIDKKISISIMAMFLMSSVFFMFGSYFSYTIIIPLSITFFTSLSSSYVPVDYNITLENYMTYVIWMIFVAGLVFQLPIVSIIFKKLGLIDYRTLADNRRYSILAIFVISALLTPPDPFSQILFVIPLLILYEFSILIIRFIK
jgi:sec-independent protein translocase protein TatC